MPEPRLFLDADGVLADFDEGATRLLGMSPRDYERKHGRGVFWKRLAQATNFYGTLSEMPDARLLFDAVRHLDPTILTGLPLGRWAAPQKIEWAAEHFPGVPIITCMARDKHKHMRAGDVLVTIAKTTAPPMKRRASSSSITRAPRTASGSWRRSSRR